MQIVIDIPEDVYKASQKLYNNFEDTIQIPLEVIVNGTPLPKGHGRLIDVDEVDRVIINSGDWIGNINENLKLIESISTILEADKEGEK